MGSDSSPTQPWTPGLPELQVHPEAGQQPLGAAHRGPTDARGVSRHRVHPDRDLQVSVQPSRPSQRPTTREEQQREILIQARKERIQGLPQWKEWKLNKIKLSD